MKYIFFNKIKNYLNNYKKLFVNEFPQIDIKNNIDKKQFKKISSKKSSVAIHNGKRVLALDNDDCALVLHDQGQCEVIFTKYNKDDQNFTANEELLMALTIFLKQKGFGDMLISEFHRVAMNNSKELFEEEKEKGK